jgi:PIN domain nuclease of toxin-antitoxin system
VIVLDTMAWIWWTSAPEKLSRRAAREIDSAAQSASASVSSFSVWELAMLVARGRLQFSLDLGEWLAECEKLPGIRFVPVSNAIALASVNLPGAFHADPADRIIVATARHLGASIVTSDQKIRRYAHVKAIW